MKKILVLAATIALVSSSAFAAGSATLNVTASVQGQCTITGGNLVFGALDPILAPAVSATATGVAVNCTNNTIYTVSDNAASTPLTNGGNSINFSLSHANGGTGTGGIEEPYAITGNIAAGAYLAKPAGAYASSVTLIINP